ncbi:MAG: hypothetical protein H6739_08135 [Alphaproteobacteria bacterium]|nr:hypothetical protein [Alphaproteobacteria bacterium]
MTTDPPKEQPSLRWKWGSYLVILALALTTLLAFTALSVDVAYTRMVVHQAQNAADAAAHGAIVALRTSGDVSTAHAVAREIVSMNRVTGDLVDPAHDFEITFGGWDFATRTFDPFGEVTNAVRVKVSRTSAGGDRPVPLLMAPILGFESVDVVTESIAALRYRNLAVVQDVTGSFAPDIALAREADLAILDALNEATFPGDQVAMICFTGGTTDDEGFPSPWTPLQYVAEDYAAIRAVWDTLDWCDKDMPPDTTNGDRDHMLNCRAGGDGTNQGAGMDDAIELLLADGDPEALKVIVVISDGKYQCYNDPTCSPLSRRDYAYDMADRAAANDISVYTVSLNKSYSAEQTQFLANLARGYGRFYETDEPEELPEILAEIARNVPVALVK